MSYPPRQSEYLQAHTSQERLAASMLNHRDLAIPYLSSVKVWRERWRCQVCPRRQYDDMGEAMNHKRNNNHPVEQMFYEVDLQLFPPRKIAVEIYGEGTSSFDRERQEFLHAQRWRVFYVSNETIEKRPDEFVQLVSLIKVVVEAGML